ncbi:LOW QUALITY PROTEIN: hypothetical protein U9M48_015779 [Paspalum notatum var. saurae]|uniref:Reverse transcriptase zinc-binding domain-containing protein n=1 Tax=Paspalum notatum var. saurae TaxID=547442 RepID=A0AAQ3WM94_PASNO
MPTCWGQTVHSAPRQGTNPTLTFQHTARISANTAHDLQHLDEPLTEQEVHRAILDTPQEKALGSDGFIGMFYKKCWHIIKADLMKALEDAFCLRSRHWNLLNTANISLIPKHDEPKLPQDYRLISLTHMYAESTCLSYCNSLALDRNGGTLFHIFGHLLHQESFSMEPRVTQYNIGESSSRGPSVPYRILDQATQQGQLTPIGGDPVRLRTSLYVDDAALFVHPIQQDLENLQRILDHFGAATGLRTNIQKTSIYKIRCENIDVEHMLQQFRGSAFPCKYLGLPLHYGRQRRADEQVLIDKIGAKLAGWKGRLLTRAGRLTLVQSVLGAIPTYHMTVFNLSKWAGKKIDRICRNFLWKAEDARGGHCLVNWRRVNRFKALGGLGIKDLHYFNRALRLKWLWTKWKDPDRPWADFKVNCTEAEMDIFRACTQLSLGDGNRISFWHDRWLQGQTPKQIAPLCFKLVWRKNLTVAETLQGNSWMRGLRHSTWRLSSSGEYTFDAQFIGSYSNHQWEKVWKAKVEPKCRFFVWLLLQQKILTSDKILRRGGQANPICQLCRIEQESTLHMVANCYFAKLTCSGSPEDEPAYTYNSATGDKNQTLVDADDRART